MKKNEELKDLTDDLAEHLMSFDEVFISIDRLSEVIYNYLVDTDTIRMSDMLRFILDNYSLHSKTTKTE